MFDLNGISTLIIDLDRTLSPVDTLRILRLRWRFIHPLRARDLRQWRSVSKQEEKLNLWQGVGFRCLIPMNRAVVALVEFAKSCGITVVVASGSAQDLATTVGKQVQADFAFGSSQNTNLTREAKANFLKDTFDLTSAAYVGDSSADCPVWSLCAKGFVVKDRRKSSNQVGCVDNLISISSERLFFKFWAFSKLLTAPVVLNR